MLSPRGERIARVLALAAMPAGMALALIFPNHPTTDVPTGFHVAHSADLDTSHVTYAPGYVGDVFHVGADGRLYTSDGDLAEPLDP